MSTDRKSNAKINAMPQTSNESLIGVAKLMRSQLDCIALRIGWRNVGGEEPDDNS